VVPVYLAYHERAGAEPCLYGFTTPGRKVEWLRANPRVCVEVDEVAAGDRWVSLIVFGRYEELPNLPESGDERLRTQERPQRLADAMPIWSDDIHHHCPGEASEDERERAWQVLKTHPEWWEAGAAASAARTSRDPTEPYHLVYYKIWIDQITGHEATPDPRVEIASAVPTAPARKWTWLSWSLTRFVGPKSQ